MISFEWCGVQFELVFVSSGVMRKNIQNHCHAKNCYEIHFVNGGKGEVVAGGGRYTLSKGVLYVTGAGAYHEQLTDSEDPLNEWCVYLQTTSKHTNSTMAAMFLEKPFWVGKTDISPTLFNTVTEEYTQKRFGYEQVICGMMSAILTGTIRAYYPDSELACNENIDLYNRRLYLIECAFLYDAGTLTLCDLSQRIGVCERQTQRILKQHYGMTFREKRRAALKST